MSTPKMRFIVSFCFFMICSVLLVWLLSTEELPALASSAGTDPALTGPITDQEIVRNGGFDQDKTGWYVSGISSAVDNVGQDGGPALYILAIMESNVMLYQELYLPSQTTAATFAFDYRMFPNMSPPSGYAQFWARVVTASDNIVTALATESINYDTGWQNVTWDLSAAEVTEIQAAHAAGQQVWVVFDLLQNQPNSMSVYLDNVSFKASGSMDVPTAIGSIAFVGSDNSGYPTTVNRINPDGSGRQTLWTHPSAFPSTNSMYDVAWKPDASELAFSSNHEQGYSAFNSDVYGVQPDGSGLRRITNPPSKAELDAGGYPMGTVTGQVHNNYSLVTTFLIYIEGAKEPVSVDVEGFGDTVGFTIPNVADLGTSNYVVFIWSKLTADCASGIEYPTAVLDVVAGQTVDVGTLDFSGKCGEYNSNSITWKRDGSQIGVDVITPKKFDATGESFGTDLFSAPITADEPAWSPVNDQILYRNWIVSGNRGIYLTTAGGGTGNWLVNEGSALYVTPAWLPDGSGFVYTLDNYIYEYTLSNSQVTTLTQFYNEFVANPSLSPDGNYVVFDRGTTGIAPIQYDLWILNRSNPVEMWQLTADGKSTNPDWSRQTPGTACTALTGVSISGATDGLTQIAYNFEAGVTPSDASTPINYTWSPAPASGQGTSRASYSWTTEGTKTIEVTVSNCGGTRSDTHEIAISAADQFVFLPVALKSQ